jgi:hypothetical protein
VTVNRGTSLRREERPVTPDIITDDGTDCPTVAIECVVHTPTVVDNLRVGGVLVIEPAKPILLKPGDRLRLVIDRAPGWTQKPKGKKMA